MADGVHRTRFTLDRRDLDAADLPWARVDEGEDFDSITDLRAQVVGTGHPVLWRLSGCDWPEYSCTGAWSDPKSWWQTDPVEMVAWGRWWRCGSARIPPCVWMLACVAVTRQLIYALPVEVREPCDAAMASIEAYIADDRGGGSLSVVSGHAERAVRDMEPGLMPASFVGDAVIEAVNMWERRDPHLVLARDVLPAALRYWGAPKSSRAAILRTLGVRA